MIQAQLVQEQSDAANLSRLHDVVLPPEVSMLPSAPGWWWVGIALLVALCVFALHFIRRHRALQYRREALETLKAMRAANEVEQVPVLLKHVALCAYPRTEVASLSGPAWTQFLDQHGGAGSFASGAGETLAALAYHPESASGSGELFDAAEAWIQVQGPAR